MSTGELLDPPPNLLLDGCDDPYPYLALARRRASVQAEWPLPFDIGGEAPTEEPDICVLGYEEVVAVLRDPETYSSQFLGEVMGPMFDRTIIAMDEPEHRAHRALVAPAFRPKLLARWQETLVRHVVDELVDAFASRGHADLVRELTFPFPVRVIARILGLPAHDVDRFQQWSFDVIRIFVEWDRGIAALDELRTYMTALIDDRRTAPGDDLISELLAIEVDGERLDDEAVFAFVRLLLPAGVETTYRSFGNLLFALLTHPEQLDEITGDPDLRGAAIEEALRWEPPFLMVARKSTRATRLGDFDIPAGRWINTFIGSANHDERRYEDPERFDIHRASRPHITFGFGPHICLGMHLSRMEMRAALDAVLERLPNLRLDDTAPAPRVTGTFFRSPETLPVCFDPR